MVPPPDVQDHVTEWFMYVQARPDGGGHGFVDQVNVSDAGHVRRFDHGPFFHLSNAGRHTNDRARLEKMAAPLDLEQKEFDHLLGHREIGDHTIPHRSDRFDLFGCPPHELLGLLADRDHFS